MRGTIYSVFDTSNGRFYVGQTRKVFVRRKGEHLNRSRHESRYPFHRALYVRPDSFVWSVLVSGISSREELNRAEISFVKELDSVWPNGYNLTEGGEGAISVIPVPRGKDHWNFGRAHTEEHNRKIGNSIRGRKVTEETRALLSEQKKEYWNEVRSGLRKPHTLRPKRTKS